MNVVRVLLMLMLLLSASSHRGEAAVLTAAEKAAALAAHNSYRCNVSPSATFMPAMLWDSEIEAVTQKWANTCPTGHNANRTAVYGKGYIGENIAWGYSSLVTATDGWAAEVSNYNLTSNTCASGKSCGHYTQVVWANSIKLGCAKPATTCPTWGDKVYVCDYGPGGNFNGLPPYTAGTGINAACAAVGSSTAVSSSGSSSSSTAAASRSSSTASSRKSSSSSTAAGNRRSSSSSTGGSVHIGSSSTGGNNIPVLDTLSTAGIDDDGGLLTSSSSSGSVVLLIGSTAFDANTTSLSVGSGNDDSMLSAATRIHGATPLFAVLASTLSMAMALFG